jgi:hypothetical protein
MAPPPALDCPMTCWSGRNPATDNANNDLMSDELILFFM